MITIRKSPTADTRTCDFANVSKETLLASSSQHIDDVRSGLEFFGEELREAARVHDHDKLSDIDGFHRDFITGFKNTTWWDNHRRVNRHHLLQADGVPADVKPYRRVRHGGGLRDGGYGAVRRGVQAGYQRRGFAEGI